MSTESIKHAILIVQQEITTHAKKALALGDTTSKFKIELFRETELMVDITEHQLVPPHTKLTGDEKKALLER